MSSEVLTQGYVVDEQTLELVPPGSSKEQVLLSLGSPTTKGDYGQETFYYISQKRKRAAMFLKPRLVEQSILAVYFDDEGTVTNIANYTMEDGKVFDTIHRTTPTGGKEETFLSRVLSSVGSSGEGAAKQIFSGQSQ
ncbi:outer membrane protein assembly factor BamE [Hoeflea sp. TYP-13]|uniref:outer membrane protein assembly factor BamE n=1 Tax=Hoeflea sp. TYP-13 TaxID=3230023 RepID=UPI0034C5FDD5